MDKKDVGRERTGDVEGVSLDSKKLEKEKETL